MNRLILTGAISIKNSLTHFLDNLFKTETKNRVVKVRLPINKYNEGLQPVPKIDQHDMFAIKVAGNSFCACSCWCDTACAQELQNNKQTHHWFCDHFIC